MPAKKSAANRALAGAIRSEREQQGYAQESFAKHIGMDRSYYGAIERGEFNITIDTLTTIAHGLGVRASTLLRRAKL
jgi:transcriptional regulator with XRE-family HTH domain